MSEFEPRAAHQVYVHETEVVHGGVNVLKRLVVLPVLIVLDALLVLYEIAMWLKKKVSVAD